jgi:protein gp37
MSDKSGIEWTDATWNPIAGCSVLSPACTNCYAMAQAARIQRMAEGVGKPTHYAGTTKEVNGKAVWTGKIVEAPEHIFTLPLRWKRPRRIFVNSTSDLFHPNVQIETIDRIFSIMQYASGHTFQLLTKRPDRMHEYAERVWNARGPSLAIEGWANGKRYTLGPWKHIDETDWHWPPPNIYLGVTVEDQKRADERREPMRALAALGWRIFVSYEPALGPVDWTGWEFVSQIIVGGESGPDARPMHPDWARDALAFCRKNRIAFFFKQWGEWLPFGQGGFTHWTAAKQTDKNKWLGVAHFNDGAGGPETYSSGKIEARIIDQLTGLQACRVGKTRAGRLLDGIEYSEFPEAR